MKQNKRIWIFLPGWGGDNSVWDGYKVLPCLSDDTLFLDYGYFSINRDFVPLDFNGIIKGLPHEEIIIAGYSLGGLIALGSSCIRIKAIILLSSFPCFCSVLEFPLGKDYEIIEQMQKGILRSPEKQLMAFYRNQSFPLKSVFVKRTFYNKEALYNDLGFLKNTNYWSLLDKHICPVLIMHGAMDRIVDKDVVNGMSARLNNVNSIIFPDSGHLLIEHQKDTCIEAIKKFMSNI